jgi:hypothetical protein
MHPYTLLDEVLVCGHICDVKMTLVELVTMPLLQEVQEMWS